MVNGSSGIAVGMATNIPPHNITEVINGIVEVIEKPETSIEEIMAHIKGPDFPTAGIIMGKTGIRDAYKTGRGKVVIRAKTEIEEMKNNRQRIIVTELPYQVNKARLLEKIAEHVKEKRIEGISDLRDESDRDGMRIVIELKRDANANIVLNQLYKNTQMRNTFSIIMLALVDNEPKILNLKQIIENYIDFQKEVIIRRTQFDLKKAKAREHILQGLKIALDNIDEIVETIRSSKNTTIAKERLIEKFKLTEIQAQAILDMRLARLTGLERDKIEAEYKEILKTIDYLNSILASDEKVLEIVREELILIKDKYGDERRTKIEASIDEINIEDLIEKEDNIITLTHFGYIKRINVNAYKSQRRGGKGVVGLSTREEDFVETIFITSTHHNILFFTDKGKMYRLKTYQIPEAGRQARGMAIVNLLQIEAGEKITAVIPVKDFKEGQYLLMATKNGIVKKTKLKLYDTARQKGLAAINLRGNDELIRVKLTNGNQQVMLVTRNGISIRFNEGDVRSTGRTSQGVKGIHLKKEDYIIGMSLIKAGADLLVVTENGFGKRTSLMEYRKQKRGGRGIKTYNITAKTGKIAGIKIVTDKDDIMLINSDGTIIRIHAKDISTIGRTTQGVTLMRMNKNIKLIGIARLEEEIEEVEDKEEIEEIEEAEDKEE